MSLEEARWLNDWCLGKVKFGVIGKIANETPNQPSSHLFSILLISHCPGWIIQKLINMGRNVSFPEFHSICLYLFSTILSFRPSCGKGVEEAELVLYSPQFFEGNVAGLRVD